MRESTCFAALIFLVVVNATYMRALMCIDPSLHSPLSLFPSLGSAAPILLSTHSLFIFLT